MKQLTHTMIPVDMATSRVQCPRIRWCQILSPVSLSSPLPRQPEMAQNCLACKRGLSNRLVLRVLLFLPLRMLATFLLLEPALCAVPETATASCPWDMRQDHRCRGRVNTDLRRHPRFCSTTSSNNHFSGTADVEEEKNGPDVALFPRPYVSDSQPNERRVGILLK